LAETPFEFKLSRPDIVGFEMKENLVFNGKDEQKELLVIKLKISQGFLIN